MRSMRCLMRVMKGRGEEGGTAVGMAVGVVMVRVVLLGVMSGQPTN